MNKDIGQKIVNENLQKMRDICRNMSYESLDNFSYIATQLDGILRELQQLNDSNFASIDYLNEKFANIRSQVKIAMKNGEIKN